MAKLLLRNEMETIDKSKICFIVSARTKEGVEEKAAELRSLGVPFMVICAEKTDTPEAIYREKKGKFDAINYAAGFTGGHTKIICLNDVDNRICNFDKAVEKMVRTQAGLVFCKIKVDSGPQIQFYSLMDRIRRVLPITSSGDLMLIRKNVFDKLLPIPSCKTEDNYISFKVPELGYKVLFCEECWVETKKTSTLAEESEYKTRTVTGLYQALSLTKTTPLIRVFYLGLPFISPLLLLQGKRGAAWAKGIIQGFTNFIRGDKGGAFEKIGG
jgi:hypothetical protein